jgi:hydroxylaminobenzene mutase
VAIATARRPRRRHSAIKIQTIRKQRETTIMERTGRRLMFHGMCLFLLGLLTGFAEQHFVNVRMGLAAHLEGVMNGIFLLALGAVWTSVRLSPTASTIAFWLVLYGTYINWFMTLLAAIFGTAALSPITGVGHSGQPWQESFVTTGFMSVGIAIVLASAMILWGLRKEVSR